MKTYSVVFCRFVLGGSLERQTICSGRDLKYAEFLAQTIADGMGLSRTNAHEIEPSNVTKAWLHQEDHIVLSVSLIPVEQEAH